MEGSSNRITSTDANELHVIMSTELYLRKNKNCREGYYQVYPFHDPPHLIKGIRNNSLTKLFKYSINIKRGVACLSHIMKIYNRNSSYKGVIIAPKLTARHVMPELMLKMRSIVP